MDGFYYKLLHLMANIPKQIEIKCTKTMKSKNDCVLLVCLCETIRIKIICVRHYLLLCL